LTTPALLPGQETASESRMTSEPAVVRRKRARTSGWNQPGKATFDERSLTIYESAGFTQAEADQAAATVLMFVIGAAQGQAAQAARQAHLRRNGADADKELQETTAEMLALARTFPRLRARVDSAATTPPADPFKFGLNTLPTGLQARTPSPTPPSP